MKKLLIASAIIATVGIGSFAYAKPHGSEMHHHDTVKSSVKNMVKQLRGLSLTDAQKDEVKSLIATFKEETANSRRARKEDRKHNGFDRQALVEATDAELIEIIKQRIAKQTKKHLAVAALQHDIFNVLTAEQQATLNQRHQAFKEKREDMRQEMLTSARERRGGSYQERHDSYEGQRRGSAHDFARGPAQNMDIEFFDNITLSEEQKAAIADIRETQKENRALHRETFKAFKHAQRELIKSDNFTEEAFLAIAAQYEDELVSAALDKVKSKKAMLAVLTDDQKNALKSNRREARGLMELLN
ncbi:hypothetical protein BM528_02290 [Alteromonas sp. RW2A1]|uniref:Spy/CpxP family protein refolding chaperone n=2 Tax=unclassified Alteromonas TaxID=2614992 RepID=UPI00090331C0|nr:Spy/CpxP family protein refolding chaperone [Alteromonas sp. RW2A1]APE04747.1 hypothetical protein BM528_02290 [Alteromonas sp. RW2A1]